MRNDFRPGDLVIVNSEAGTRIGWTGVVMSLCDRFVRVSLTKNIVGENVFDMVDFLPSMLTSRKVEAVQKGA